MRKKLISSKRNDGAVYVKNISNKNIKIYLSKRYWNYKPRRNLAHFIQIDKVKVYDESWITRGYEYFVKVVNLSDVNIEIVKSHNKHTYISFKDREEV